MREGAWINAKTGDYVWIDDHARWLRRNPDQAAQLGLPEDIIAELGEIGWDITPLAERVIVLFKAMDAGFIRARGHGAYVTFEFSIPWADAVRGARRFMMENFGPSMACRFNSLTTNQTIEFHYGRYAERLGEADLSFLLPPWKRPRFRPPVPRPFLVSNIAGEGWICWSLPGDLEAHALVDLIREALPQEGGWLALGDGRTWKLTPDTPRSCVYTTVRPSSTSRSARTAVGHGSAQMPLASATPRTIPATAVFPSFGRRPCTITFIWMDG